MKNPTIIRAGAVAKDGIAKKIGDKNRATKNNPAETKEVNPDLPPSAIPDADSAKVVMVEVPKIAPAVVPMASAIRAPRMEGSLPSSSSILALEAQPIRVPKVSNTSTKRKANNNLIVSNPIMPVPRTLVQKKILINTHLLNKEKY